MREEEEEQTSVSISISVSVSVSVSIPSLNNFLRAFAPYFLSLPGPQTHRFIGRIAKNRDSCRGNMHGRRRSNI